MATSDEAKTALFAAIKAIAESAPDYGGVSGSAMVRDAAIAYRAVSGGQQPESVVVELK